MPDSLPPVSQPLAALRVLFFGTPEIAVPTLEGLIAGPHHVVGVISQPDRARGRGRRESPSPVSAVALREGIPLHRPEKIGDAESTEMLRALEPDIGVVVAFGQFLPKKIREMPDCGYLINAHASLLPKYRGASPIAQAILDDEPETGVSVMRVEKEMDSGAVALVLRTAIASQENTAELSLRLGNLASRSIEEALGAIADETIEWTEQDESLVTIAPKLEKSDSILDFRESARSLACRIHALSPKPGGALTLTSDSKDAFPDIDLKISRADVMAFDSTDDSEDGVRPMPGSVGQHSSERPFRIAAGDGWLLPLMVQRAGGKALPVADFLRGFSIPENVHCVIREREAASSETARGVLSESQTNTRTEAPVGAKANS
ncbi:MAG TPA: methionyl-tRNA formyltransferase [Myxococcales bacterium]|nr:methionyl-tRNA formyltransferase [Myxococcales bacterium]HIK85390.1 methionyl-tRNA formyltransferase [Myxococcales bacterium]